MCFGEKDTTFSFKKSIHFTYKEEIDVASLCQGDVLCPTDDLINIIEQVYPHFKTDEYRYFIVLSQSCDLVRRAGNKCKTPFITIAAVKSYDSFISEIFVENKLAEQYNGIFLMDLKKREKAFQFIEKLFNNTLPEYFFLYKDDILEFPESMVAYLKLSIALKSEECYDICLKAKKIELSDEFKAKIGWLIGDMYSRVGTTDWESVMSSQERKAMFAKELNSKCVIGDKDQIKKFKKMATDIGSIEDAAVVMDGIVVQSKYDQVILAIEECFNQASKKIPKEEKTMLLNSIKSKQKLKTLIQ